MQSTLAQVNHALQDRERLLKRSQIRRAQGRVFGIPDVVSKLNV